MKQSSLVPDSEEVTVESVTSLADGQILLVLRAASGQVFCPRCQRLSFHVHSHYLRHLCDLPWEGIPVQIQLHVRRFFCRAEDCEQAIFTERLPHTVLRYARRTCRLSKTIRQITMALDSNGGTCFTEPCCMATSKKDTRCSEIYRRVVPSFSSDRAMCKIGA